MNHTNAFINITVDGKTYSINYAYNKHTTFYDFLENFIFLYPELNICQCYKFHTLRNKRNYNISRTSNISNYEYCLNNLALIKSRNDCHHNEENYLLCSKLNLISMFESKIEDYKKIIEDKDKKYSELEKKYSKKIDMLNSEIKKLEYDIALLEFDIKGIPSKKEFLEKMGFRKKGNLKENPNLLEKNQQNQQNGQIIVKNPENKKENFINFYDIIIHIDSIKEINKGWKIEMNEKGKQNYEKYKNENILKIGVIGSANKGKSYFLSKISKNKLPAGTRIKTEGLSIKYPDLEIFTSKKIVLLDSAGLETPVLVAKGSKEEEKNNDELFKEKCREKLITELFLQNYIINISDILIVVVDFLSFLEQKFLMKIKKELKKARRILPLYIIHNLKEFTIKKQVEDYIENTLLKSASFTLKEWIINKNKSRTCFLEDKKDVNEPNIFHLIYANENSEAGNYYDQCTLDFIENIYQNTTNYKPFDIIESIKDRFVELSGEIIEKIDNKEKIEKKNFNVSTSNSIKLNNKKEIILKQYLIDEIGVSNLKPNGFEPKYNLYNTDDKIIIKVECPGNSSIRSYIEPIGEYYIIRIDGEKEDDDSEKFIDKTISLNKREFGKFKIEIPLNAHKYILSYQEPSIKKEKGIFIIEYKLFKKPIVKEFRDIN